MLTNIVADPALAKHMVFYPEERHVHRPGTECDSMQVREELWHGKLWWDMQVKIGLFGVSRFSSLISIIGLPWSGEMCSVSSHLH